MTDELSRELLEVGQTICAQLREKGIESCIVGGLAMCNHGSTRATEDVDILVVNGAQWKMARDELAKNPDFSVPPEKRQEPADLAYCLRYLYKNEVVVDFLKGRPKGYGPIVCAKVDKSDFIDLPGLVEMKCDAVKKRRALKDKVDLLFLIKDKALSSSYAQEHKFTKANRQKFEMVWDESQAAVGEVATASAELQ